MKKLSTHLSEKQIITDKKKVLNINLRPFKNSGSVVVRISNKFIADLKRMAEVDIKMTEYDELGKLLKLRKEKDALIPKIIDKRIKVRAKRKSRKVLLKKWILNISDD